MNLELEEMAAFPDTESIGVIAETAMHNTEVALRNHQKMEARIKELEAEVDKLRGNRSARMAEVHEQGYDRAIKMVLALPE